MDLKMLCEDELERVQAAAYSGEGLLFRVSALHRHCDSSSDIIAKTEAKLLLQYSNDEERLSVAQSNIENMCDMKCLVNPLRIAAKTVTSKFKDDVARFEDKIASAKAINDESAVRELIMELAKTYRIAGKIETAQEKLSEIRKVTKDIVHAIDIRIESIRTSIIGGLAGCSTFEQIAEKAFKKINDIDSIDVVRRSHINFAVGLSSLLSNNFMRAANMFITIDMQSCDCILEVFTRYDIIVYSCLCVLASFSRQHMKNIMSDSGSFSLQLDIEPEWHAIMNDCIHSRYSSCLRRLQILLPSISCDTFIGQFAQQLFTLIRHRFLKLYCEPFSVVDLCKMARVFKLSLADLEKELVELVGSGVLSHRIDKECKTMKQSSVQGYNSLIRDTLDIATFTMADISMSILRSNLLKANIVIARDDTQ